MNRERIAWSISLVLLVIATFRFTPSLANRDEDYAWVRTFVDIHRQVTANYVERVDEEKLRQAAIDGMLGQLDAFTMYVPPSKVEDFDRMIEGTFRGVGIQLNQLDNGKVEVVTPIEGSPAHRAGVLAGDIIVKVNGESIEGMRLPEVIKRIGGEIGTEVRLTVLHLNGETAELSMKRQEIVNPTVKGYQRNADNTWDWYVSPKSKIAYLRITQFTPSTLDTVQPALEALLKEGMQGLVLDLRFNPGGQLDQAVRLVDLFLEEGTIVITRGRNRPEDIKRAAEEGTLPAFPMVVLVNAHSASASEIVAGSLQDNGRAMVVGMRTYGKGSVQELIPLEGRNGELKLTVAYYYLPSGRLVHRRKDAKDWGVEPNFVVNMTDEQEKAMQKQRLEQESFRRPASGPASRNAVNGTLGSVDPQLQKAVDTLEAMIFSQGTRKAPATAATTTTTRWAP
jgi:carboxyl-terminal processing protease